MTESVRDDAHRHLERFRAALEALAAHLDAMEKRPHLLVRHDAESSEDRASRGIETFVDRFAFAVKNGKST